MNDNSRIVENRELSLGEALVPVVVLIVLLAANIFTYDGAMLGDYSNQYILLFSGVVAAVMGFFNSTSLATMVQEVIANLKSVIVPILILCLVGALAGTWLVSGIIPAMVYYGLEVLSPAIFLPASVIIAAIISIATGSSWTTSATVGIALIAIGSAMSIPAGMIAGAVISGAYFGDKMSPLSDTTNLAPAMAGTDLFTHIRYMTITTVPSILITLVIFGILSFTIDTSGSADVSRIQAVIQETFNISPLLFIVPALVVGLIVMKTKPLIALATGVVAAAVFAVIFQAPILQGLTGSNFQSIIQATFTDSSIAIDPINITTGDGGTKALDLSDLFSAPGMLGMLWTILLIIAAMVFGGVMDGIGALARITKSLLQLATTVFGLFASTVASCLALNVTASDQYLAIVVPGKMFAQAYEDRGLAPENLSRTLEDSGTVTSVLIPWNTCGAYQSATLGVDVGQYFVYAIFNYLSPFMTLFFAAMNIKIRQLAK